MSKDMAALAKSYTARADAMEKAYLQYGSGIDSDYWPDVRLVNTPGQVVYLRERAALLVERVKGDVRYSGASTGRWISLTSPKSI